MTPEIAIAMLSVSIPLTAIILRVKRPNGNATYVTEREFDTFKTDIKLALANINSKLEKLLKSRL